LFTQYAKGAQRYIFQVADWGGDNVQCALQAIKVYCRS
jgi:hypothetical protein